MNASPWVERFAALIPPGLVLDLACGGGRHSKLLAARGYQVLALDRDPVMLQQAAGENIQTLHFDLENGAPWPFPSAYFSGIVMTNYLFRPIFSSMLDSLVPQGILIAETFAAGNARFGRPSNPAFLLSPGELLQLPGLRVIAFEDGFSAQPKPAMVQRICAIKQVGELEPASLRLN